MQTSFASIPDELWERVEKWLPKRKRKSNSLAGRPPKPDRVVMAGIIYRLRTGCQWDAIPAEFGSSSTCRRRFAEWQKAGVFFMMWVEALLIYDEERGVDWNWSSLDSASVKAPKGGISPAPIPPIVASSAPRGMYWPMVVASRLASR
jgi:transposase